MPIMVPKNAAEPTAVVAVVEPNKLVTCATCDAVKPIALLTAGMAVPALPAVVPVIATLVLSEVKAKVPPIPVMLVISEMLTSNAGIAAPKLVANNKADAASTTVPARIRPVP